MSLSRKLFFWTLTLLGLLAFVEGAAWVFLGLSKESWQPLDDVQRQRQAVLGGKVEAAAPTVDLGHLGRPQALHPYLGYTDDPSREENQLEHLPRFSFPHDLEAELVFEPSDDRVVVGVFGGSVASIVALGGSGLAMELRRLERFHGKEVRVISLALGGYKQPQQLLALNYLLALGAHFDLVLNIDGFNEVALPAVELVPRGVFPFYPQAWDQRVGTMSSELRQAAALVTERREHRDELARSFSRRPWRSSHTAGLLWQALDTRAVGSISKAEAALNAPPGVDSRNTPGSPATHGPQRAYASSEAMYEDLAGLWQGASLQMFQIAKARGIEYHHFLQPNQYLEGSKPVDAERQEGTWQDDHPYRTAVEDGYPHLLRLGEELVAEGVAFHDLTPIFEDRHELLYKDSCCHLGFLGNTLLQRAVAERLSPNGFRHPQNVSDQGLALAGYDPVAYFAGGPRVGRADLETVHEGLRYRFATSEHRERFLANPESYLPRYGGWCAYGLGLDEEATGLQPERYPADPESFEIHDGKLYLFYRSPVFDARQRWLADRAAHVERASTTWGRWR